MLKLNKASLFTASRTVILSNINLEIGTNDFIHLIGRNGIGKTSFVKGLVGQGASFKGLENLFKSWFYLPQLESTDILLPIKLKDISRADIFLTNEERKLSWRHASGGQRKKAMIEYALGSESEMYILDEPYNHLDSESCEKLDKFLLKLHEKSKCIVLVGHRDFSDNKKIRRVDLAQWS